MYRVLLVEDEATLREVISSAMEEAGCQVEATGDGADAKRHLDYREYDLLLTDVRLPNVSGTELFRHCRSATPRTECILMTAFATVEDAVTLLKEGAYHYLRKPFDMDELLHHVARLMEERRLATELRSLREEVGALPDSTGLHGNSGPMARVRELIRTVAKSRSNVLITGESGTGKTVAARAIHRIGAMSGSPFVAVNCAAIPETLLESELFGHEPGSFTGATRRHEGFFEQAAGGTLLLDEIGDLSRTAQAKVLQAVQERSFRRVGGCRPVELEFRLICASHQDLKAMTDAGTFRTDLYYRLNVVEIVIPPLSERSEDIPSLCELFLRRYARTAAKRIDAISPEAMSLLQSHHYQGNVREIQNAIERAVVLCQEKVIRAEHLPPAITGSGSTHGEPRGTLKEAMRTFEASYIRHVLEDRKMNRTKAANALGISRKHLWSRMRELGLQAESNKSSQEG